MYRHHVTPARVHSFQHITYPSFRLPFLILSLYEMLSILRKARLKDKELRVLLLCEDYHCSLSKLTNQQRFRWRWEKFDLRSASERATGWDKSYVRVQHQDDWAWWVCKQRRVMEMKLTRLGTNSIYVGSDIDFGERDWLNLGIGDVGGQKTLRTYWRNYFERTDTLIWVWNMERKMLEANDSDSAGSGCNGPT